MILSLERRPLIVVNPRGVSCESRMVARERHNNPAEGAEMDVLRYPLALKLIGGPDNVRRSLRSSVGIKENREACVARHTVSRRPVRRPAVHAIRIAGY